MKSISSITVAVVVGVVAATHGTHAHLHDRAAPLEIRQYNALTYQGCYSSAGSMSKIKTWTYNTEGYCQEQCVPADFNVEATSAGKDCYCGNELPPSDAKVEDSKCSTPCAGFGEVNCGGSGFFSVYLTGREDTAVEGTGDVPVSSSAASASSTISASPSVVTVGGETMTVTAGATVSPEPEPIKSSGPSKAGIAAGAVVGVLVIAAAAGGGFLFWRHKKRQELHDEHQKAAAVSEFIANGKSPASCAGESFDTHLDPSIMASNRLSNGSLADNADYSRRILKVTNA